MSDVFPKKGDCIILLNNGGTYDGYDKKATELKLTNWIENSLPKINKKYKIIAIDKENQHMGIQDLETKQTYVFTTKIEYHGLDNHIYYTLLKQGQIEFDF